MSEILPEPFPERVASMTLGTAPRAMFTVGVVLTTRDAAGLKVIPTKEIAFCIGGHDDPERNMFRMHPCTARDVCKRILEMCDEVDGE